MGAGLQPTTRFSDRVQDYARSRPSYPLRAIDAFLEGLGARAGLTIADVGAGTGISSRLIADAINDSGAPRVLAVEPNREMREAGERAAHPRVEWIDATGEATTLPDASVDAVFCAQAFHWLDPVAALAEFRRILRPRGRVALVWNTRNPDDPATEAYYDVMARHAVEGPQSPWASNDVRDNRFVRPLAASALFTNYRRLLFTNEQRLDREGFLGRARSASYVPKEGEAGRRVAEELGRVFDRHAPGGEFVMRYLTEVHLAEAAS